jgi:hypothetical protein
MTPFYKVDKNLEKHFVNDCIKVDFELKVIKKPERTI